MQRQVTLKDVALEAGVSYQTVSKVLNGRGQVSKETEERIRAVARQLGYRPHAIARNMRAQRSFMIGYSWVPTGPDQVNHILDQFLTSMVEEAEAAGYHLLPFTYRDGNAQVEDYRQLIDSGMVDGFVITSVNYDDPRILYLMKRGFPFVAFGRSNPEYDFSYVDVDGADGLRQVVEHLVSTGRQRIAILAWPEDSRVGNERLAGFFQAMAAAGLEPDPKWVLRGEGTFEFGCQAASHLLALPAGRRPNAIVTLNDTQAIGAMRAAHDLGLTIGKDIAIIGFDDAPMAQYLFPPLSSVRQPIRVAGRKCVEILLHLMRGEKPAEDKVLLKPNLVVRASG